MGGNLRGAARHAAHAAGQAGAVADDAAHQLVLDDQRLRNALCWSVFD